MGDRHPGVRLKPLSSFRERPTRFAAGVDGTCARSLIVALSLEGLAAYSSWRSYLGGLTALSPLACP